MHRVLVAFLLASCAAALQAQYGAATAGNEIMVQKSTTGPDGKTTWTTQTYKEPINVVPLLNGCPVSFKAQQSAAAFEREVGIAQPKGPAQRLHLTVSNPPSRRIVAATVTVRGFGEKPRQVNTETNKENPTMAKTVAVRFAEDRLSDKVADFWAAGLSAVSSVELNSLTYSDGTTWKVAENACTTPIDGVMYIGAR